MTDSHRDFVPLTTKARTLAGLRGVLTAARALDQVVMTVRQWQANPAECLQAVGEKLGYGQLFAVRSSAPNEDTASASLAGAYRTVLNVDLNNLWSAVKDVIGSYSSRNSEPFDHFEILVQPMLLGVKLAGVILTRDLHTHGPYYVISYDRSGSTCSVTAGSDNHDRCLVHHEADRTDVGDSLPPDLMAALDAAKELIELVGNDRLDIEFAIDEAGVIILQVRPLVMDGDTLRVDAQVAKLLNEARETWHVYDQRQPNIYGSGTAFSDMTDWNPAEIIGTHPRALAISLYQRLVTQRVWRVSRASLGYHHPNGHRLMVTLAGHPYVDIRADFNSYLPDDLPPALSHRLIDHYVSRLREHPELHDKAEFEIVPTSLAFDWPDHAARLATAGFSQVEVATIRGSLLRLTRSIVRDSRGNLAAMHSAVAKLPDRRERVLTTIAPVNPLDAAEALLTDAIDFGTLPFATAVRATFVGIAFWRSILTQGWITPAQHDGFLGSIKTIATRFASDFDRCVNGDLPKQQFLAVYGHLRPGTYDITVPTYRDEPTKYLRGDRSLVPSQALTCDATPVLPDSVLSSITDALYRFGFDFDALTLLEFIRAGQVNREAYKFVFTASLSAALDQMAAFGRTHGLTREDLSHLPVETLLSFAGHRLSAQEVGSLKKASELNRNIHQIAGYAILPDVLTSRRDISIIRGQRRVPNFITQRQVTARLVVLNAASSSGDEVLRGCIVVVESADPGWEWLFGQGVSGLITRYGGAASHMAIRCAEGQIPAAIGVGEQIYSTLANIASGAEITLDCADEKISTSSGRAVH